MSAALAAVATAPMTPRAYVVAKATRDVGDMVTLTLQPREDREPFYFSPGQFNMLYLFGTGEVPISISGDPAEPDRLVHTIRAVGTVTRAMAALKKGAVLGVRGPFGNAWPVEEAERHDIVVVGGGAGLAPLRPAILTILANRGRYGRFAVLYGARTPKDILFRAELARWSARLDSYVDVSVDRAAGDWFGNVGVVTRLIAHAPFDPENAYAFVCGPEIMMRFAVHALLDRGVARNRIHISMERNMKCAVGFCGHCQFGGQFVCRDGPVFSYDRIEPLMAVREF